MVVAVTAEKKVATVDRLRRFAAPCFCANRIMGTPRIVQKLNDHGLEVTHRLRQTLRWWKLYCLCVLPFHLIGHVYSFEQADNGNALRPCQSISTMEG